MSNKKSLIVINRHGEEHAVEIESNSLLLLSNFNTNDIETLRDQLAPQDLDNVVIAAVCDGTALLLTETDLNGFGWYRKHDN